MVVITLPKKELCPNPTRRRHAIKDEKAIISSGSIL